MTPELAVPYADPAAQRRAQREWIARRRADFFAGKTCEWCSSGEALQLHHRDPSRKVAHSVWSWSASRRDEETAKCVVLCGECHRRAHSEARRLEAELRNPHGTPNRYKLGCSCDLCRLANRERNSERTRELRMGAA